MFHVLEEARKLRNKVVHQIYKTKSTKLIDQRAKESAEYNLGPVQNHMFDRQDGIVVSPALLIRTKARNELRQELREKIMAL